LTTHNLTDRKSIREEREGKEALARSLHSLEPSEGSEKKILVDVLGSLKEPCKAGVPMEASGLMESA
jgi:hypothetical protein